MIPCCVVTLAYRSVRDSQTKKVVQHSPLTPNVWFHFFSSHFFFYFRSAWFCECSIGREQRHSVRWLHGKTVHHFLKFDVTVAWLSATTPNCWPTCPCRQLHMLLCQHHSPGYLLQLSHQPQATRPHNMFFNQRFWLKGTRGALRKQV